jgi:UDP-N-acetyl-D-galactosamine dehydrogenase
VLVLGITFKENCPDIRNSRVIDISEEFKSYAINVDVFDPWASKEEVAHEYGFDLLDNETQLKTDYDGIVLAVSHNEFLTIDLLKLKSDTSVIFDVKSLLPKHISDARL